MSSNTEVRSLNGGRKAMWLRQHRGQVVKYYQLNGDLATREHFNLQPDTLHRLLNSKNGNGHGHELDIAAQKESIMRMLRVKQSSTVVIITPTREVIPLLKDLIQGESL